LITIVAVVYLNMHNLDFLLDWEPPTDKETRKKFGSAERVEKIQKVFLSQSRRMTCQLIWIFLLTAGTVIAGFVLSRLRGAFVCDQATQSWTFKSETLGVWFYTFILITCYMSCAVLRVTFVKQIKP